MCISSDFKPLTLIGAPGGGISQSLVRSGIGGSGEYQWAGDSERVTTVSQNDLSWISRKGGIDCDPSPADKLKELQVSDVSTELA